MAELKPRKTPEEMKRQVLFAAAKSFLESGYTDSSLKHIAETAGINIGSLMNLFKTKEDILCELVKFVLETQFNTTAKMLKDKTDDKIKFYAVETVLQLHIVESDENLRDIYSAAYSMPKTSSIIQHIVTGKLENIFKEHLPDLKTQDFYKLEIATGGIMRGFMTIPCDMWFTMDQKIESFLETTFLIYRVPKEKIRETIDFVNQIDFKSVAENTVESIISYLEKTI